MSVGVAWIGYRLRHWNSLTFDGMTTGWVSSEVFFLPRRSLIVVRIHR